MRRLFFSKPFFLFSTLSLGEGVSRNAGSVVGRINHVYGTTAEVISQKKKTSSVQIPVRLFVCLLVFACLCMSVGLSVGMVNPAVMNVMIVVTGVSWNC